LLQQRAKEIVEAQLAEVEYSERDELYQRAIELVQLLPSIYVLHPAAAARYSRAARMI
jgi:hypothetical protein